jgi:spore maturation protein CgeB
LVLVHEWNPPELVAAVGRAKRLGHFTLLFHDTHHRAVSDPSALYRYDLSDYDGVLAFGAVLARIYEREGWGRRAFIWHEAADTRLFHPPVAPLPRDGVVFIGNWGDDERSGELVEYLLRPTRDAGTSLTVHGVRYSPEALDALRAHGARYRGWVANCCAPSIFARSAATIHVPRRYYAETLPGIPTIRVFEALAAGVPLLCAPWQDSEGLFNPGRDYLVASDGVEMTALLKTVLADGELRQALADSGRASVLARHTCAHRANELLEIAEVLRAPATQAEQETA